ncbi:crtp1 [Symbiodinium necroappetens]|uniref:Crtp1 protein n=1 Tax=Symbiodinium necroappetens TaxID=1628268 RepID=A0A812YT07_9DINO|nr:crtp1 [Symbiodinium necroappetens]
MDDRSSCDAHASQPRGMEVAIDESSPSTQSEGSKKPGHASFLLQVSLLVAVVVFGCANNIAKQIAAQPLKRYTYMLGLSTAVAYVPLYWFILTLLLLVGVVPKSQLRFVWQRGAEGDGVASATPAVALLFVSALGDSLGDTIGAICTPHVSGPLHSLLSNCTPIFIAVLSMCLLEERYSLMQSLALLGVQLSVFAAVVGPRAAMKTTGGILHMSRASRPPEVTGLLPALEGLSATTEPVFAVILGGTVRCDLFSEIRFGCAGSCIFNAASWMQLCPPPCLRVRARHGFSGVMASSIPAVSASLPMCRGRVRAQGARLHAIQGQFLRCVISEVPEVGLVQKRQDVESTAGLNIFVMNAHLALFQLPLTILLIPLNVLLKQTHGEGIGAYTREALDCVFGGRAESCGEDSNHGELAGRCVGIYVIFNVLWNMAVLMSVKHSGALATFIALKAIFPVSTVLFAYVDWPLLGPTELSGLVWLSILLLLPSIAAYQYATQLQVQRALGHPSRGLCCWPLGQRSPAARGSLRGARDELAVAG